MIDSDISELKAHIDSFSSFEDISIFDFYVHLTARYHPYIPKLGDGLYGYIAQFGMYDEIDSTSLLYNLKQIYNKLLTYKSLGYPFLNTLASENTSPPLVQITNTNTNSNSLSISFDETRKQIEEMSSLPDCEIEEILEKINQLESIISSKERKSKKWEKCKDILLWIADKGVDVGIAFLPLILQLK